MVGAALHSESNQALALLHNLLYENPPLKRRTVLMLLPRITPESREARVLSIIEVVLQGECKELVEMLLKAHVIQFWLKVIVETRRFELLFWVQRVPFREKVDKTVVFLLWEMFVGLKAEANRNTVIEFFTRCLNPPYRTLTE